MPTSPAAHGDTPPTPPDTGESGEKHRRDEARRPATPGDGAASAPRVVRGDETGFPVPPEGIVAAARAAPGHWLSVNDRNWRGDAAEPPPPWAVLGRWRSDENGEIVEWEENPEYVPSPEALGWAPPVGPADAALQLAATGYGPGEAVTDALADGEVAVCVGQDGQPEVTSPGDGSSAVPVFPVSPDLDGSELPAHVVLPVSTLVRQLPPDTQVLLLSSSAPVSLLVPAEELRTAAEGRGGAAVNQSSGAPERQ